MGKALVIVESPTKIKTLKKFLGKNYQIESSVGHIRDLPTKDFGIDVEHDFEPHYVTLPDKKEVITRLKKAAKECDLVYLSPDPDREGEAIAWHIASILPKNVQAKRVTFYEITKDAVLEAFKNPREIDQSLVNAQQARRLLDRIVGYKISPILQRRIKNGPNGALSAGRVQSVALKLVVDREKEIESFVPIEYWTISALLQPSKNGKIFEAYLYSYQGKKFEKEGDAHFTIPNEEKAKEITDLLKKAHFVVENVEKKEKKRNPVAPFITSTLQQEASRHFGFSAAKTMHIAQTLYEGVDLGDEGAEGLITYMRTDSVRISPEAIREVRKYIGKHFGKQYLPETPVQYIAKKSAQDAHEAIRPTSLIRPPDSIKRYLSIDQFKLYDLIWKRFVACQMPPAIYDTLTCDIETDKEILLRATGSIIKFNGFLAVYEEKEDRETEVQEHLLPPLKKGEGLTLVEPKAVQSFTKPPPRFTEASLVKELEKSGIGRPSTYATIMNKIQSRAYTTKERLALKPTELGKVIAEMLEMNFKLIMDIDFTARMEDDLDEIAASQKDWKAFLHEFWDKFIPLVKTAEKEAFVPKILTDIDCPKCGAKLQKIWSKNKYFYGCSRYPDCDFTSPIEAFEFRKEDYADDFGWNQVCPVCGSPMNLRFGRYGPFLGCTRYPDCKGLVNIPKKGEVLTEMPNCPAIGCNGKMVMRRSRFGKPFYSCSSYPDCDVIVNDLGDLESKYPHHPKTPYVKKKSGRKGGARGGGGNLTPSPELAAVIGKDKVTRGEATKKLWDYIKTNHLQDPENRRLIVPDEHLKKLFGQSEPLDMMKLARILSNHLSR